MKQNSISAALDQVNVEPSPVFRSDLRAQFIIEMSQSEAPTTLVPVRSGGVGDNAADGTTVTVIDATPARYRRPNVVVGIAAAIILVAVITSVALTRRSEPTSEPGHDAAIAEAALLTTAELGGGWSVLPDAGPTIPEMATIAEKVPACAAYVDSAFPRQNAVTKGRDFQGEPLQPLTTFVYIFATEAAASEAMAKMAEDAFVPCFNAFVDALSPATGGFGSHTTTVAAPPFAAHGDAQVVIPQSIEQAGRGTFTLISFFVQVGRGIVYVDPILRKSDPTDSSGKLEKVVAAATNALTAALQSSG